MSARVPGRTPPRGRRGTSSLVVVLLLVVLLLFLPPSPPAARALLGRLALAVARHVLRRGRVLFRILVAVV